jgi:hypothetical protein
MSVAKLTAVFGNEKLEAVVDERKNVSNFAVLATSEGKTVVTGSYSTKRTQDMFRINLGNFPPKSKCTVTLVVYQTLEVQDMGHCFRIPMQYVPRYTPLEDIVEVGSSKNKLDMEDFFDL